ISIESQSGGKQAKAEAASSELSPDNQSNPGKVETATPNISNHRQLSSRVTRTPDCGGSESGSWRCSTESQVTGNHIGPAVDDTIRTIRQRNRIAANGMATGPTERDGAEDAVGQIVGAHHVSGRQAAWKHEVVAVDEHAGRRPIRRCGPVAVRIGAGPCARLRISGRLAG